MFSNPLMFRNVSCWPANDASGRSSAVADERTAHVAFGASAVRAAKATRISSTRAGGSVASATQRRISCPALASALTSSTFSAASRSAMRSSSRLAAQKLTECECGGGEAARDADARMRELIDHLAEGGVLAAHMLDVGHAKAIERKYPDLLAHATPCGFAVGVPAQARHRPSCVEPDFTVCNVRAGRDDRSRQRRCDDQ